MTTRAEVEKAAAEHPRSHLIVSDADGHLLAERPAAEGGSCVLVVLNIDMSKEIAEGRFSARPGSQSFSLTGVQKRALARGRRQRAKEREAASRKQSAEFEAEYTAAGGTRGSSRADSVPAAAPGKAGGHRPPPHGRASERLETI